jgi:energy-coupling factor transporter ATP-binding protein EcfA2
MRLRYIYLPDYGPLKEVAVVFERNPHIENRDGSINFVVGLNGSGKSSLLRAIYDVFLSLSSEQLPKFPVTLAYDMRIDKRWDELDERWGGLSREDIEPANASKFVHQTVIFHRPRGPASEAFLMLSEEMLLHNLADEWQRSIEQMPSEQGVDTPELGQAPFEYIVWGDRLQGDGRLRNWLPTRVLAYTSGDMVPWQSLAYPSFPVEELKDDPQDFDREQERPAGWRADQEHYDVRIPTVSDPAYDPPLDSVSEYRTPIDERCLLLQPEDARLAAISVGIWQAALDLEGRSESWQHEAFRQERIREIDSKKPVEDPARRLLNELDWLWPTHAAFHFASYARHLRHPDAGRCFWLLALADAVVRYPLDEALAVVNLGNCPPVRPSSLIGEMIFNLDHQPEANLQYSANPMTNAHCGAEALRSLFGGEQDPDESLWSIFSTLRNWRAFGLLKDVNLTVKRAHPVMAADGQPDDSILSYASFSDGEQMLLGRMAFLLLLRKQDNSLLLLDEPETHFNDAWKRQIIDMVDDSILKDTSAQVLVSTHTSLALTDVFSCEITRLVKDQGTTRAERVAHPTFGADPGRILLHVFGAPDVIGARAAEFLREKLNKVEWSADEIEKLSKLIDEIGSGWPRAKLMDMLDELNTREGLHRAPFDS